MSKKEMQLLRKKKGTGQHTISGGFSDGTLLNNEPVEGTIHIKPGDRILCYPDELGKPHHLDNYEAVSGPGKPVVLEPEEDEKPEVGLPVMIKRKGSNWYDVFNPANLDKPINKKALTRAQAEALIKEITDQEPKDDGLEELDWDNLVEIATEQEGLDFDEGWEKEEDIIQSIREARNK